MAGWGSRRLSAVQGRNMLFAQVAGELARRTRWSGGRHGGIGGFDALTWSSPPGVSAGFGAAGDRHRLKLGAEFSAPGTHQVGRGGGQAPPCWRLMKPLARRPMSSFHAGSSSTVRIRRAC